ncbi:telomeric repeat-binding factor 2-like isoform X2 [Dysidea avara]|uniref:telomeric repeat-binding factor 2-like isoform X2 n=1 Tax=Dysidea avara TaxID=196820 RepID=UPI003319BEA7
MDSLTSFLSHSVPTYKDLFTVRHPENQALLLFENYLCYRALLDVLSLRSSRWEELVKVLFSHMKDAVDEECKRWLCCVHLGVLIRDAVLHSSYDNYSNVLKCFKSNSELFPNKSDYKKLVNQLNISIACYCLIIEKDKVMAAEACDTNDTVLELISSFPDFSVHQTEFMYGQKPHTALIKILDNLSTFLPHKMFDEYLRAAQEKDNTTVLDETENDRDVSPPLLTSTSVSADPPMDEARKMSGPQTRAKTAAAQFDSKDTKMVAKSPRKVVSTTADKTDSGNDSGPKTITSYYSLRSGTKSAATDSVATEKQPNSPAAKLKSPYKKSQSTPTKLQATPSKLQATPSKSPSSKSRATPSEFPSTPLNTRLTPSRSYLTPTKPQVTSLRSPSKLTTHVESEQPITDGLTVVAVIMGSDAEDNSDDGAVTPQATPSKRAMIVESSSNSGEAEQPTSTVQQSEDPSTTLHRRGLRDLKETGEVPNSWSSSSEDSDFFTAIPKGISIKHRRRRSLTVTPRPKKYKVSSAIRHPWTHSESKLLVEGVERFGLGQWAAILQHYKFPAYRDNVSLKDRWRNMKKNHEVPDKFL